MKTVLVIDENDLVRESTARILAMAPYQVLKAQNEQQGLFMALQQKPDVVLCDSSMYDQENNGVQKMFSKIPAFATIPFIFLSAGKDMGRNPQITQNEEHNYITTPGHYSDLLKIIEGQLRQADKETLPVKQMDEEYGGMPHTVWPCPELESLVLGKKIYFYKKKQLLYLAGNEPSRLYFIKKGKVKIYRSNPDGKDFITGICREGDFFGYLALIEETGYEEAAETLEDAEIVLIPKEEFFSLLYNNSFMAKRLIKMLAHSVSEKEQWLTGMAYNSLRKRTADSLLFLYSKFQTREEPHPAIQISRDDIAGIVGSSTESLIRTLSEFKSEHLIDIVNGRILILDQQKLQHVRK